MTNRTALLFAQVPAWSRPTAASALSFFETIALAGLEGQWIRMSAADQRAILGYPIFGKQEFRVLPEGIVEVFRSTAFGMDGEIGQYDLHAIKLAIRRKQRMSPGMSGARYLSLGAEWLLDVIRTAGCDGEAKALADAGKWHELDRLISTLTGERGTNWPNMRQAAAILGA